MSARLRLILITSIILLICLGGFLIATSLEWYPFMWFLLVPGVAGFLSWIVLERKVLMDFLGTRSSKNGLSMGGLCLAVLIVLITINFIGARYNKIFDLSLTQQFTLSDQAKKIIDGLTDKMQLVYFYQEGLENSERDKKTFGRLTNVFENYSNKIKLEFVEINSRPALAKDFGATRPMGEAFISYKDKKYRIEGPTEQDFVNAMIKSTRSSFKTIYFTAGHGERPMDQDKNPLAVSAFANLLSKNSYKVEPLNLFQSGQIPKDASVIVIAGPTDKFERNEIVLLHSFMASGGQLLIFLENRFSAGLEPVLNPLGIELQPYYVGNVFTREGQPYVDIRVPTVAVQFASTHQITKMFTQNSGASFLQPSAFELKEPQNDFKTDILIKTPDAAVALPELASDNYIGKPRSFTLVVESTGHWNKSTKKFRVIAVSDVDVISNTLLFQRSNKDLVLNTVSYLAGEDDLVSIAPKNPQVSTLLMKDPEYSQFFKLILVGVFIPIPFVFMLISGLLWFRRKHA